ncbi:MAG: hypothetical protein SGILL_000596 [Bacillariaceae sp.]
MTLQQNSLLLIALLLSSTLSTTSAIGAFQSGPNVGALYAGGLSVKDGTLIATGITYDDNGATATQECSCFLARFDTTALQNDADKASRIGSGHIVEACAAVALTAADDSTDNFIIAGNSDPGGMYGFPDVATGFAMALSTAEFQVQTGKALESEMVSYPAAVVSGDSSLANNFYVATLTSTSLEKSLLYDTVNNSYEQPNWLKYKQYGKSYEMTIEGVELNGSNQMLPLFSTNFPVTPDPTGDGATKDVYIGGMILKRLRTREVLIVGGSTRGHGPGYGEADGDDEDGFLTLLDPELGSLLETSGKNQERIGTAEDDVIAGICDDPRDEDHFYIVGGTKGDMGTPAGGTPRAGSLQAYIQKINLETLSVVWSVQWGAEHSGGGSSVAIANECIVTSDSMVYVAGVVNDGADIAPSVRTGTSHGGHDIFVAQLDTVDGSVMWTQQVGSPGDEELARGGALALDDHDDVIVYGDTTGNFYRERGADDTSSDIFLVTLNKNDGSYPQTGKAMEKATVAVPGGSVPAPGTGGSAPAPTPAATEPGNGNGSVGASTLDASLGIQSGPGSGSHYAGGMVYDAGQDFVYLTGIVYEDFSKGSTGDLSTPEPQCLLASVSLDGGEIWDLEDMQTFGEPVEMNVCTSLAVHRSSELIAVGYGDGIQNPLDGAALAFDRGSLESLTTTPLLTSTPSSRFEYPMSIVSDGDDLYIVALTSTDGEPSTEYSELQAAGASAPTEPNYINIQKYGSSFDMTVTKLTMSPEAFIDGLPAGNIQFNTQWVQEFPVEIDPATGKKPRVWIGGAILKRDPGYLAIAGSTRGLGNAYGDAVGDDEDGFITLLDLASGELASNVQRNNKREGTERDDITNGICHDPQDPNYFYIVGKTYGDMGEDLSQNGGFASGSGYAYVQKVDANTLSKVWTKQFGAATSNADSPAQVYALSCAVSGSVVYAGGVVDGNAGIVVGGDTRQSAGGDDMWVGQFSISNGAMNWIHQVGSSGDDHMAPHDGIIATTSGNAIVYGDTNGAAFRSRDISDLHDLLVMTFSQDGTEYKDINRERAPTPAPTAPLTPAPVQAPSPNVIPQPTAVITEDIPLAPVGMIPAATMQQKEGMSPTAIAFLVIGIVIILAIPAWWFCRKRSRRNKTLDQKVADMEMMEQRSALNGSVENNKDGIFGGVSNGFYDDPLAGQSVNVSELATKGGQII